MQQFQYLAALLILEANDPSFKILSTEEKIYRYAKVFLKGRYSKGEPGIMKDPKWAYLYAKDVIATDAILRKNPEVGEIVAEQGAIASANRNQLRRRGLAKP